MKRLISLFVIATMLSSWLPALAEEGVFPVVSCTYDTFINGANYKDAVSNEDSPVVFAGDVYDRTVFMEFDISGGVPENAKGAVLGFFARPSEAGASVIVYGCDSIENFGPYSKSVAFVTLTNSGKQLCRFSVLDYITECISSGKTKALFAIRSSADVLPIFSSESTNKDDRPYISYSDMEIYIKGTKDFDYPKITREMLSQDIEKMQQGGHPYLFFRADDLERIRKDVNGGNEFLVNQYAGVKKKAEKHLTTEPVPRGEPNGIGIARGFSAWEIVSECAFVYLMEGDERFAQRAYKEVEYFATLESFGEKQFIDIAQIVFAAALCYDWLYDWMDESMRSTIKQGYLTKHFNTISRFFNNPNEPEFQPSRFTGFYDGNNHCVINNTMTVVGALAFADDANISFYADLIAHSMRLLEPAFDNLYPDSAWYEGPSYWNFVGPFFARMFACMKSGLGTWYGYEQIPCVVNTSDYQLYAQSNQGYFMVNDCSQGSSHDMEKYYFAIMKNDDGLKKLVLDLDKPKDSVFHCIWYDTSLDHENTVASSVSLDKFFRNQDQVIFRNTWEGNQELYTGMVVMPAYLTHGHMNSGTIALDALGERWITNQGGESYLTGYFNNEPDGERWKWHGTRAEANSCLVINPSGYGGQYIYSEDVIDKFASGKGTSFAWADLTETYKDQVTSYKRGLMLTNNRRTVVLQDEMILTETSEVYSFINFHTSEFEISEDGKTVTVTKGNKKLRLNIICDVPYEVSTMRYAALPTSNLLAGSMRNKDLKKLVIRIPEAVKANIRIEMTPYLFDEDLEIIPENKFVPIEEWKTVEDERDIPVLLNLKINGVTHENFNPQNRCYVISEDIKDARIEAIADSKAYEVETSLYSEGVYKIIVKDKSDETNVNSYMIYNSEPKREASIIDVSGMKKIDVKKVSASEEPQAENKAVNVLDGDFSTRWSANSAKSSTGEQYLTFAFAKPADVNCVALAFYRDGTERIAYFDIQISSDGAKWETVGEYDSSGITDGFEYYEIGDKKASYVRIMCYGTNVSSWNSITEAAFYAK
ncbi:MAG: discoidin domain-containing protein [Clostridia bacterium]|nr:discoidin domain-containing protein [Clostridia bacterium]